MVITVDISAITQSKTAICTKCMKIYGFESEDLKREEEVITSTRHPAIYKGEGTIRRFDWFHFDCPSCGEKLYSYADMASEIVEHWKD